MPVWGKPKYPWDAGKKSSAYALRWFPGDPHRFNDKLSPHDKTLNNELEGIYLLGFSHQRAYRKDKTDQLKTEEEN